MKRYLLFLGLIVGLVFCASFAHSGSVSAARSFNPACSGGGDPNDSNANNPDDINFFPYSWMCGTDPGDTRRMTFDVTKSSDGTNVAGGTISSTQSVNVHIRFSGGGNGPRAENNAPAPNSALLWVKIDTGPGGQNGSISGTAGTTAGCPGAGASQYGPVYGYRDMRTDFKVNASGYPGAKNPNDPNGPYSQGSSKTRVNGVNASPIAYNPGNGNGVVNCGANGKMVYWTSAQSDSDYRFTYKVPSNRGDNICIRANLSVQFGGDQGRLFPSASGNTDPYEQDVAAAHLVKQSNEICYSSQPPTTHTGNSYDVDMETAGCNVAGHIIKYNGSGQATNSVNGYFLFWWNPENPDPNPDNRWEAVGGGNTNGGDNSFYVGLSAAKADQIFANGRQAAFQVRNGASYGRLPSDPGGIILGGVDCHDDPTFVDFTATCHSVYLTSFSDGDRGDGLEGTINVYDRGNGSRGWTWIPRGGAGRTIEFSQAPDQTNNGIDVYVSAFAAHPPNGDAPVSDSNVVQTLHSPGPCYAAQCTITAQSPGLPPNNIERGKPFSIRATITNTGDGDNNPLYSNLSGNDLTITPDWGNMASNASVGFNLPRSLGKTVQLGESQYTDFSGYTAPDRFGTLTLRAYPDYYGRFAIRQSAGDPNVLACEAKNVKLVQHFHLAPHASLSSSPSDGEDPSAITYSTKLTLQNLSNPSQPSKPVKSPATSEFYRLPVGTANPPGRQYVDGPIVNTNGPYTNGDNTTINPKTYTVPPGFRAGDKYCSEVETTEFNDGFIGEGGPDDVVRGTALDDGLPTPRNIAPGPSDTNCLTINNKSFFKVFNNNISAGGDFADASGGACNGGGQLGGWFGADDPNYGYGASTQLSALALLKIYGVASAQTLPSRSFTDLTFANSVAADKTLPAMGGNFGAGSAAASHCLSDLKPADGAVVLPSGDLSTLPKAKKSYTHNGNVTLSGGDGAFSSGVDADHSSNVSIFVNGDVYISSNITYNTAGWVATGNTKTIPSFVLHANGNIYIAPNVTQLDGLYIAAPKVDASGAVVTPKSKGAIYTCGTAAYTPVTGGDTHYTCNSQLTVHGSFVAEHVNLMRTYGTMRNEKPKQHVDGGTPAHGQSVALHRYVCSGGTAPLGRHQYSLKSNGGDVGADCSYEGIVGYILPPDDPPPAGQAVALYKQYTGSIFSADQVLSTNYSFPGVTSTGGFPTKIGYVPVNGTAGTTAIHEYRTSPTGYFYSAGPGGDPAVNDGRVTRTLNDFNVYNSPGMGGTPETPATINGHDPPDFPLQCETNGVTSFTRLQKNGGPATCAAEVFDFSPEMYLSDQSLAPPSNGAIQFDAITSLPPVL